MHFLASHEPVRYDHLVCTPVPPTACPALAQVAYAAGSEFLEPIPPGTVLMRYSPPIWSRFRATLRLRFGLVFFALLASPCAIADAQEWTRFRGPNGTGISDATTIPATWTDDDYHWKIDLPGIGHASPVIWGNKIFLLSADPETVTRTVLCLDAADGHTIWSRSYPSSKHVKHQLNSFASATPAVDAERVYVAWSTPDEYTFVAFDHDGNEQWKLNLGPYISQHSCGTSPIVYEDLVILGNDQDGDSSLVAVERTTGSIRWRVPRAEGGCGLLHPLRLFTRRGQTAAHL